MVQGRPWAKFVVAVITGLVAIDLVIILALSQLRTPLPHVAAWLGMPYGDLIWVLLVLYPAAIIEWFSVLWFIGKIRVGVGRL